MPAGAPADEVALIISLGSRTAGAFVRKSSGSVHRLAPEWK
jgi:hypothetical protein